MFLRAKTNSGAEILINPEHVAVVVRAHATCITVHANGTTFNVEGTVEQFAEALAGDVSDRGVIDMVPEKPAEEKPT